MIDDIMPPLSLFGPISWISLNSGKCNIIAVKSSAVPDREVRCVFYAFEDQCRENCQ